MPVLKVIYPIVRFNSVDVTVSDEKKDEIESMNIEDKAKWIEDIHQLFAPDEIILDRKNLIGALDTEYATIKESVF